MSELSPLSGEERKSNSEVVRSVDPNSDIETDQSSEAGASPHPRVLCSHFASHEIFRTFNRSREDRNNRIIAGSEDEPDRRPWCSSPLFYPRRHNETDPTLG